MHAIYRELDEILGRADSQTAALLEKTVRNVVQRWWNNGVAKPLQRTLWDIRLATLKPQKGVSQTSRLICQQTEGGGCSLVFKYE